MKLLPGLRVRVCWICALDRAGAIGRTAGSRETAEKLGLLVPDGDR